MFTSITKNLVIFVLCALSLKFILNNNTAISAPSAGVPYIISKNIVKNKQTVSIPKQTDNKKQIVPAINSDKSDKQNKSTYSENKSLNEQFCLGTQTKLQMMKQNTYRKITLDYHYNNPVIPNICIQKHNNTNLDIKTKKAELGPVNITSGKMVS